MRKKAQAQKSLQKTTRRFEAWIYSVINPLIDALKVENSFLKDGNWTWRFQTKDLEFILPLERYVDSVSLPNFADFFKANRKVDLKREKHDELRASLAENCRIAFEYLVNWNEFKNKIRSNLSLYKQTWGYPGGAVPEKDFDMLVAQYVVNKIVKLPEHYATSKFWESLGNEFLEFRTGEKFEKLDESGKQLEKENERLLITLENFRTDLCEKYDIPAAPVIY